MKTGLLILAGLFVVGGVYVYYKTATPVKVKKVANKATKNSIWDNIVNGSFQSPKAGVTVNQPVLNVTNLVSGILHPTNTNNTTGTTGSLHADTSTSSSSATA